MHKFKIWIVAAWVLLGFYLGTRWEACQMYVCVSPWQWWISWKPDEARAVWMGVLATFAATAAALWISFRQRRDQLVDEKQHLQEKLAEQSAMTSAVAGMVFSDLKAAGWRLKNSIPPCEKLIANPPVSADSFVHDFMMPEADSLLKLGDMLLRLPGDLCGEIASIRSELTLYNKLLDALFHEGDANIGYARQGGPMGLAMRAPHVQKATFEEIRAAAISVLDRVIATGPKVARLKSADFVDDEQFFARLLDA